MSETDREIEERTRIEMALYTPIRLRVPGPYEIAALLRRLDQRDLVLQSVAEAVEDQDYNGALVMIRMSKE